MRSEIFVVHYCVLLAFTSCETIAVAALNPFSPFLQRLALSCFSHKDSFRFLKKDESFQEERTWIQWSSGFMGCKHQSQWFLVSWFAVGRRDPTSRQPAQMFWILSFVYLSAPLMRCAIRVQCVGGVQLINFLRTWGEQRTPGA